MVNEITVGLAMMVVITIIHALFMTVGIRLAEWRKAYFGPARKPLMRSDLVAIFSVDL